MTGAIPPGYCSRLEAIERAERKWGRRDGMGKLKGLLVSGELIGWDGNSPLRMLKLSPEFWITHDSWGVLEGERTYLQGGRSPFLLFEQGNLDQVLPITEDEGRVPEGTESKAFEKSDEGDSARVTTPPVRTAGGRPAKYAWEDMWVEVAALLFEEGNFESLDERAEVAFRKRMQDWFFGTVGEAPDDNLIRPRIHKLFNRLRKTE